MLLDGLDEVPNEFTNSVMNAIDNLVTQYEKNRFLVSCRIAAYRSDLQSDFQVIELADFDDQQIEQFINNWFSSELDKQSRTAKKCWDILNEKNNKAAKELAQTPLLLTFLCLVYHRKQNFPATRSRLYNKALDILLEEWAAEKRIQQEIIYEGLHVDLEKEMLAEIAYQNFVDDQLFFEEQQLVKNIRDFLAQTDNIDNPKKIDGKKILSEIAAQQGILVERAEDIYSFSHLTLQEYLTAQYISEDDEHIEKLVTKYFVDRRWKEVFILVAGAKGNADKLLKRMEIATQQLINTNKLEQLLDWVKEITDPNSNPKDFRPVGKRALAIANAYAYARAYANANAYAYTYAKVDTNAYVIAYTIVKAYANTSASASAIVKANAYASAIVKAIVNANANANANANTEILSDFLSYILWSQEFQIYQNVNYTQLLAKLEEHHKQIPTGNDSIKVHKVFTQQIIQTLLKAFHLNSEMLNLSPILLKSLNNYLYAINLILECKQAAVRVSRATWQGIESRMLLPTKN